ncbi:MAG: hypothetical protein JO199_01560 [Candidatus Eremiobacteraeota bacterium]|nr:hypothetical protein [Candidatus Eremiobacteraeota bacterium]
MKRFILAAAVAAALILPVSTQAANNNRLGIVIQSCVVNKGNDGLTNGINVVYTNTHAENAVAVTFVVEYNHNRYFLTDTGTFSQGAQINHNLNGSLVGQAWTGPEPAACTVRKTVMSNGRTFQ